MTIAPSRPRIRIAIIGAGPGGLAATINLLRLPFVDLSVYDQASALREIGAGISINQNTWRLLKLLGAAEQIEQHSKRVDGRVDELVDTVPVGDVGDRCADARVGALMRLDGGRIDVADMDAGADLGEGACDRRADARGAAGDQDLQLGGWCEEFDGFHEDLMS